MENYIVINGKRAELTEEQLKQLGIVPEKKSCFDRCKKNNSHYYIDFKGSVISRIEEDSTIDDILYKNANYCTNEELMKQRALHEKLNRLLWRFSMKNNGEKIDWNENSPKYYVYFDHNNNKHDFFISYMNKYDWGNVHFYSKEIAERAIDEIIKPFMRKYPEFVW